MIEIESVTDIWFVFIIDPAYTMDQNQGMKMYYEASWYEGNCDGNNDEVSKMFMWSCLVGAFQ